MQAPPRQVFLKVLSSAIVIQALTSAASFAVGLILIRRTSDTQYGYYVLITNAILLLSALQDAFIQPPMVLRMFKVDVAKRAELIGGLSRGQRRFLLQLLGVATLVVAAGWLTGAIEAPMSLLLIAAFAAAFATLFREFFRMVLLAHRRPQDVLRADIVYVVALIAGAFAATYSSLPAVTAAVTLCFAALIGGSLAARELWRHEPWDRRASHSVLLEMAPIGMWSAAGAVIHWGFSQGYNYLVAGTLDVAAVATLAATRLLMMPVNLLSAGIRSLMMPTATLWLEKNSAATVFRRLVLVAAGLAFAAACYFAVMWVCRDWIFTHVMKKHFAQRDTLLLSWCAVFLVMIFRDQLIYLCGARGRFRPLAVVTLISAVISLSINYLALPSMGVIAAPLGVLVGELCNVAGITLLSLQEIRNSPAIQQHSV